jgi:signal transduction histidine kinase
MRLTYAQQGRGERVVAIARVIVGLIWTFALFLTVEAGRSDLPLDALRAACASFLLYSLVVLAVSWRWVRFWRWSIPIHAFDLLFFSSVLLVTGGPHSPLLLGLAFPMAAATVLFAWQSAVISVALTVCIYLATSFVPMTIEWEGALEPQFVLMRVSAFFAVAFVLIYGAWHKQKLERELLALAEWPSDVSSRVPIRDLLLQAAKVFSAPRLLLVWEEPDEPWLHVAWLAGEDFRWIREAPATYEPLVPDFLSARSFLVRDGNTDDPRLVVKFDDVLAPVRMVPIHPELQRRFHLNHYLSLALEGTTFHGRLFVLDRYDLSSDDLIAGEILSRFIVSRVDQYFLLQRAQQAAVGEERMRLSRDLHDGVLQSLTGAALQIEAVRALVLTDPEEARRRLAEIQGVIAGDQRELRGFIRQLRPAGGERTESRLTSRLTTLSERFRKQWGVEVELHTEGLSPVVPFPLRQEIYSIVSEAVANAAKHAQATKVQVLVTSRDQHVEITVRDNGRGFPFHGRFSLAELMELKRGPVTLKERIASLGGNMVVESSTSGALLEMRIPLGWQGS